MSLFNFFKRKQSSEKDNEPAFNPNQDLIKQLAIKLKEQDFDVELCTEYIGIKVNSDLKIVTSIIESPEHHPSIIHLRILAIHNKYFPQGILENIVGMGNTLEEKIKSVLDNYLTTTFPPIIESLSDEHYPEFDYFDTSGILWHSKLGDLALQGRWDSSPDGNIIFNLLKGKLETYKLTNKINWLKIYVSRLNEEIIIECLLNNVHWQEGYEILHDYGNNWKQDGEFLGQKQFIVFRRCDSFDT